MKYLLAFLCLCLTNCFGRSGSEYDIIVDRITAQYVSRICQNKEFAVMMTGGGIGGKISLGLTTTALVGISEARKLLVQKEEEFLELINKSQELQPYLERPSSAYTVGLDIAFFESYKSFAKPPYLALAYIARNTVFYSVFEVDNDRIMTIFEESYEEAYKIVYGKDRE